jgi:predicted Zn-dependent protease
MLVKQHLEDVGIDPFAMIGVLAMVAATTCFSAVTVCYIGFGPCS